MALMEYAAAVKLVSATPERMECAWVVELDAVAAAGRENMHPSSAAVVVASKTRHPTDKWMRLP